MVSTVHTYNTVQYCTVLVQYSTVPGQFHIQYCTVLYCTRLLRQQRELELLKLRP